jgi:aminopeptidase N
MSKHLLFLWIGLSLLLASRTGADTVSQSLAGAGATRLLAPADPPAARHYAPDRDMATHHLALDVTPDFHQRTLTASAKFTFAPIAKPLRELKLDAVDLRIENVTATVPLEAWQNTDQQLIVTFANAVPPDREVTVTITYTAEPKDGIYFRTPEMGYRDGDTHLFSQGESVTSRHWFPSFDAPNTKFTSEVTCRVPEGMIALSNGRLVSEAKDATSGLVAFHWAQEKPHSTYLIALAAGYFKKLEDTYRGIPLMFYTPPSEFAQAESSFRDTKDMMGFFEQEIGVPYPWAKYGQVCVNDFVAGGMENTSLTILTDGTLFPPETENIRSSESLISHELAHQWFGDLVTCKDWSHIWLNEGFATFYEALYLGHKHGRDTFLYELYHDAQTVLGQPNDVHPIVWREFKTPDDQFSYLAYPKGAWVLQMLRSQLGADLYRRCIKTYLERHAYGSVVTGDLNAVIEELSGRSFDQFFDQWVYHAHYPELEIAYAWDEPTKLAKLTVKQVQPVNENVLLFRFPLPVRFKSKATTTDRTVTVQNREENFYFALPAAPDLVRVDPDYTVLAKIKFDPPVAMLHAELADKGDVIGRILAVNAFAHRSTAESVAALKTTLNTDPFYGVRIEAANALRTLHTDEALAALLDSTNQPDARVRRQVREDLGGFYYDTALAAARATLQTEKNPDVLVPAIAALGAYASPDTRATLIGFLHSSSFRNVLADAAIAAMRAQDDPAFIAPLLEELTQREADFTSHGFAGGLGALAHLARNETSKGAVREFLLCQVNSRKRVVQRAAIAALGDLGDAKAVAALETFTHAAKDSPERQAAEQAVAAIRAVKKPADDLSGLRHEVLDLQKDNRELRQRVDDLKREFEAIAPKASANDAKRKRK